MANLNDKFFEVLSDYPGSVQDRMRAFLVSTYSYDSGLNVYDMEFLTLRNLGYTGTLDDMWKSYLVALGGSSVSSKAALLGATFYGGFNYFVNGFNPGFVADFGQEIYRNGSLGSDFSSSITHSASSNATMVDSDGLLKWRPHNLMLYSEQFDNASWVKSNVTVTANAAAAPDGTVTADRIVGTGVWLVYQNPGNLQGHTISVWAKSNTGSNQTFRFITNSSQTSGNLTATTEWQRFEFEQTSLGSSVGWGLTRDTSNGDVDLLVWGAHLYRSDLGGMVNNPDRGDSYVPTTTSAVYLPRRGHHVYNGDSWVNKGLLHESEQRVNLVPESNDFNAWVAVFSTVLQNATGPDGETSAWTLTDDGLGGASSNVYVQYSAGIPISASSPYTASLYVKAANNSVIDVKTANDDATRGGSFDVSTQTFTPQSSEVGSITDAGNGWYRCSVTWTSGADTNIALRVSFPNITRDGTNSILIYGAQLEAGSTPSSYIPTSGATVTRSAETLTVPAANLPWPSPVVIGEELVTNGTFDDATGWTLGTGWSIGAGVASSASGLSGSLLSDYDPGFVLGRVYEVKLDVNISVGGNLFVQVAGGASVNVGSTGSRSETLYLVAGSATSYGINIFANTTLVGSVDNISVKEINPLSVSIQMQGEMTYADEDSSGTAYPFLWSGGVSGDIQVRLDTQSTYTGQVVFRQYDGSAVDIVTSSTNSYSPGVNVPFNIASRHGSTFVNGAVDGTALTANTTPVALPDLSATDLQLGYDYMGTIKLFRIWADDLTDAGIAEASAPSTVPSLSLTFDGLSTSFTDGGLVV